MITSYPKLTRLWEALLDVGVTFASYICAAYLRNFTLEFYAFGGAVNWHTHWEMIRRLRRLHGLERRVEG